MVTYSINPYISFVESRLFPEFIQQAVFHRLTGEIVEPGERVYSRLFAAKPGTQISLAGDDFNNADRLQLQQLIQREFLIPPGYDPLVPLLDHYVTRPIQNPALAYRSKTGAWILVRTSMEHTVYSRKRDELPEIVEEKLSPLIAGILLIADGARTLQQIFSELRGRTNGASILDDSEFRTAIVFLTSQARQLIKFTPRPADLDHPFTSVNIVPRSLYHSERKDQPRPDSSRDTIIDFHLHDIDDASWEFDQIEPTVNHCFRFPHDALGGLDYGSRFCLSTLRPEIVPLMSSQTLDVLEVGGGTGSFALSFIKQAAKLNATSIKYHILDLSPALMANQRQVLSELLPESRHFQQDATRFDLPGHTFDLIISNEVIADFPVASVRHKAGNEFQGEGVYYLEKYDLWDKNAPDSFVVNSGAFRFIERAWKHLRPGGTLIVTEYGAEQIYPARSYNLNHDEFTIHFGHLAACAARVGFRCRLLTLQEFLAFDDDVLVLNGREEHLLCLNHVIKNYGEALPYAVVSKSDFEQRYNGIVEQTGLIGYSFSPLRNGYHFGPNIKDFLVLIMNKPQ